jgi:Flp pilus assembly protein TadB
MKRCAKCDQEYEDSYDACPHCAKKGSITWFWILLVVTIAAAVFAPGVIAMPLIVVTVIAGAFLFGRMMMRNIKEGYRS